MSEQAARAALSRMNVREVMVAAAYAGLATGLQANADLRFALLYAAGEEIVFTRVTIIPEQYVIRGIYTSNLQEGAHSLCAAMLNLTPL